MQNETESYRVRSLLTRWHVKCRRNRTANYLAANSFSRRYATLGVVAVSLSAVVGTSVFGSLGKQVDPALQIIVGGMSVLAAVLAALQTFLKYGDRASAHRLCGARYAALVRHIEELLAITVADPPAGALEGIRTKIDKLAEEAPELPEHLWRLSLREIPASESQPMVAELSSGAENTQIEAAQPGVAPAGRRVQS